MSLPIPNLDNKTFEELVEEAGKLLPVHAPPWTDHNLHDPGITIMELFAWLTEMQLYSLDQVFDHHRLKYLTLLHAAPKSASPSKVVLQLESEHSREIKAGTAVKSTSSPDELVFETDNDLRVMPVTIEKTISYVGYRDIDATPFNQPGENYYHAFGTAPQKDDYLCLGLKVRESAGQLPDAPLTLGIYLFEDDLPPKGSHGNEAEKVSPSAKVAWEYWDGRRWWTLNVNADRDDQNIRILSKSGRLSFIFPGEIPTAEPPLPKIEIENELKNKLHWIRCRVRVPGYEIPPRINRIIPNVVTAARGQTVSEEPLGRGSGLPGQTFKTRHAPIFAGTTVLEIYRPQWERWEAVRDFDASKPRDRHYVINPDKGEIYFGNGIKGAVPPQGASIKISYRYGGGTEGNVGPWTLDQIDVSGVTVSNPFPAYDGKDAESIDDAFTRFGKDLKIPYTAVTAEDYETIAKATPGIRVARAKAVILDDLDDHAVTVVVIPHSTLLKPVPSTGFLQTVCDHLQLHRLITTVVNVHAPDYVKVSVTAEIKIEPGCDLKQIIKKIDEALNRFLSPLKRETGYNEWPLGRPVYLSEVSQVIKTVDGVGCIPKLSLQASENKAGEENGNILIGKLSVVYPGTHNITGTTPQPPCEEGDHEL